MKNLIRRNSIVAVLISLLMVSLTACSSVKTAEETVEVKEEVTEVKTEVVETEPEPTAEPTPEPTPEPTAEPTPEPTPEAIVYEGIDMESMIPAEEWIATFSGIIKEPKIVICNDTTNKKVIVENEQKVTFAEGDIFFIYTPNGEFITTHNMPITQDIRFSLYTKFEIDMAQLVTKTAVSVEFMDEAGNTNYLKCTLVPE